MGKDHNQCCSSTCASTKEDPQKNIKRGGENPSHLQAPFEAALRYTTTAALVFYQNTAHHRHRNLFLFSFSSRSIQLKSLVSKRQNQLHPHLIHYRRCQTPPKSTQQTGKASIQTQAACIAFKQIGRVRRAARRRHQVPDDREDRG